MDAKLKKKAFSYKWKESLRFIKDKKDIKEIIFVPCLCHKINNSYKYTIEHDDELRKFVDYIHLIAEKCKEHHDLIGAKCPSFVSTRWIYDFDIVLFIIEHKEKIEEVFEEELADEIPQYFEILQILKTLIKIFEDPKTPFFRGFVYLERACVNFQELIDRENVFAKEFFESFLKYTLHSEDAGLWVMGYLLTEEGQRDFHQRIHDLKNDKPVNPLFIKNHKKDTMNDEIAQTTEDLAEQFLENEIEKEMQAQENNEYEEEDTNDPQTEEQQSHEQETGGEREQTTSDQNGTVPEHVSQNEQTEDASRIIFDTAKYVKPFELDNEEEEDDGDLDYCPHEEEEEEFHFLSYLSSAKKWLKDYLRNICYSPRSTETILREFNSYIDTENVFPNYKNNSRIGFSWLQIQIDYKRFAPIAEIARRLATSGLSESSCERSISQQRIIFATRRRNSNRDLLDARLKIMASTIPELKEKE